MSEGAAGPSASGGPGTSTLPAGTAPAIGADAAALEASRLEQFRREREDQLLQTALEVSRASAAAPGEVDAATLEAIAAIESGQGASIAGDDDEAIRAAMSASLEHAGAAGVDPSGGGALATDLGAGAALLSEEDQLRILTSGGDPHEAMLQLILERSRAGTSCCLGATTSFPRSCSFYLRRLPSAVCFRCVPSAAHSLLRFGWSGASPFFFSFAVFSSAFGLVHMLRLPIRG